MYPLPLFVLATTLVSFLVTYVTTPYIYKGLIRVGITGRDVHKKGAPVLAEMGGISILFGVIFGFSVMIGLSIYLLPSVLLVGLFGAFACLLIIGIVGMVDDIFQMPQIVKATLPMIAALPLIAVRAGVRTISIPLIGPVDFGVIYPLILIPLGITGAANATNMLAGINGLETGMGMMMHATILVVSFLIFPFEPAALYAAIISAAMLGALAAFFLYNRYPARVFPGDVGTLLIGGSLAAAAILGNMEKLGLILIFPYFVEFGLKALTRFKGTSFGKLRKDGTLAPPEGRPQSLTHVAMGLGRMSEWQVCAVLLAMEAVFSLLALLSVWLNYFR